MKRLLLLFLIITCGGLFGLELIFKMFCVDCNKYTEVNRHTKICKICNKNDITRSKEEYESDIDRAWCPSCERGRLTTTEGKCVVCNGDVTIPYPDYLKEQ